MTTFISLLRGINVGGRKVLMSDLKALWESLGYKEVVTYIQSGNIIFNTASKKSSDAHAAELQKVLKERYPFDIPVIVRSLAEMKAVLADNPFLSKKESNTDKLHVTFLGSMPEAAPAAALKEISYPPDECMLRGKEVFLHIPESYGETKLSNAFLEKKLKVPATTRNWKTINKLVELAT